MAEYYEEYEIIGAGFLRRLIELNAEGNVRRILIKNSDGNIVLEMPVVAGILGMFLNLPFAAIVVMIAAFNKCTMVVVREG